MEREIRNGMNEREEDGFDILDILFAFLRNWYWFVLCLGIALTGAWLYLRYTVPIYRVSGSMIIQDQKTNSSLTEEAVLEEFGVRNNTNVENEIHVLRSRSLMYRVVDTLGINITYNLEGRIRDTEVYQSPPISLTQLDTLKKGYGTIIRILPINIDQFSLLEGESDTTIIRFGYPFRYRGFNFIINLNTVISEPIPIRINIQNPEAVARSYAGKLNIRSIDFTSALSLTLDDPVPEKSIDIISTLVQVYNQSVLEDKLKSGQKTLDFIDDRLEEITKELNEVEGSVENFRRENEFPTEISERAASYLDQASTQDQALVNLDLELSLMQDMEDLLTDTENEYQSLPVTAEVFSGNLSTLVGEYNRLIFERERLLNTATANNPITQQSIRELNYLRDNIILGVRRTREELNKRKQQIQAQLAPIERRIRAIPGEERQLLQIMREQTIKASIFTFLFQKREETAISLSAQVANSKIIDPPIVNGRVSPDENRIYLLALLLGLAIPGGMILLVNFLDNKIYSEKEIKSLTPTPFLGMIGQPRTDEKIVVRKNSRSAIAEMFRLLRTNLQFFAPGKTQQTILVTSGVSGEGKTFISANLGASLALSGKRTVAVGLDLRKPKLGSYLLETPPTVGVTNYLVGEAEIEDVIVPTGMENYFLIASGPIPPNPAELLIGERVDALFTYLKEHFDCIVVDTAPVGLVTDALLLKDYVHTSVYVVRFAKTVKGSLRIIDEIYRDKKLPNCSIVLNGVKASRGRYGYEYGHGYGYGYYEEDKKKKP